MRSVSAERADRMCANDIQQERNLYKYITYTHEHSHFTMDHGNNNREIW